MGKRSDFARLERDFYPTPAAAVTPLLRHLASGTRFAEPCAGAGDLIDHLTVAGHVCVQATDIEPRREDISRADALEWMAVDGVEFVVTNPPWNRPLLHDLIVRFSDQRPTWLLIDGDWVHTKQAIPFLLRLSRIVSVGRVKWFPESPHTGKDNVAWHLFDRGNGEPPRFFGRSL